MKNLLFIFSLFFLLLISCSTSGDGDTSTTSVVPLAPTNLDGSLTNTNQVTLSWTDNSTNETGFKIDRKINNGNYSELAIVNDDITSYVDDGIELSTSYTYRVLAFNEVGNSLTYSNQVSFTTSDPITLPVISTYDVTDISYTTEICGGNVTSNGGAEVTQRGVVWSTSPSPTIALNTKTTDGTGLGDFTSNVTDLIDGTTYYIKAYATNSAGTAYGDEITFVTSNSTVQICNQTWMVENLNTTNYLNGDAIPQVSNPTEWANLTTGAWCYYNNDSANGEVYGKLYNWYAISDPRGLAPQGWHIPSEAEWNTLASCLGGGSVAGGKLKEDGLNHWANPNTSASNSSGFKGLPGGTRDHLGEFFNKSNVGYFWISSENTDTNVWGRYLYYDGANLGADDVFIEKAYGFSVRCVKD